ncbi:MAG: DUF5320 domain-containing protein [Chloroflexota bacterium]
MPFQDGTGPQGQGPRSGRGQGNCAGQCGTGRGRGAGRGLGGVNTTQGNSWLETQLNNLQAAMQSLIEQLDKTHNE